MVSHIMFSVFNLNKKEHTFFIEITESKINNFNFAIVVKQYIFRFDISMCDTDAM